MKRPIDKWAIALSAAVAVIAVFAAFQVAGGGSGAYERADSPGQLMVVPIQIERDVHGVAMVDADRKTIWVYQLSSRGPAHMRLRLLAARSWRYDSRLEQFNTDEPTPDQVRQLLENLNHPNTVDDNTDMTRENQSMDLVETRTEEKSSGE